MRRFARHLELFRIRDAQIDSDALVIEILLADRIDLVLCRGSRQRSLKGRYRYDAECQRVIPRLAAVSLYCAISVTHVRRMRQRVRRERERLADPTTGIR